MIVSPAASAKKSSARSCCTASSSWLGGGTVGLVVASIAFGAGHLLQGVDAAIATGLLGAFWGVVYLRRRSIAAPMVSHAGFDLLQILQAFLGGASAM